MREVDELLDEVDLPKSRSMMEALPELRDAIQYFLEKKREGDQRAHVSFSWFYRNKLRARFDGPSYDAVRRYVRDVMRLDVSTGEELPRGQ